MNKKLLLFFLMVCSLAMVIFAENLCRMYSIGNGIDISIVKNTTHGKINGYTIYNISIMSNAASNMRITECSIKGSGKFLDGIDPNQKVIKSYDTAEFIYASKKKSLTKSDISVTAQACD